MSIYPKTLPGIMFAVCLALIPGSWQYAQQYGDIVWLQMAFTVTFCLLLESICLQCTCRPFGELSNLTWLVTGLLLARALPLLTPLWLLAAASFGAIVLAKYACGGLGRNRLNPVLVGLSLFVQGLQIGFRVNQPGAHLFLGESVDTEQRQAALAHSDRALYDGRDVTDAVTAESLPVTQPLGAGKLIK